MTKTKGKPGKGGTQAKRPKPKGPAATALKAAFTYLDGRTWQPVEDGPRTPGLKLGALELGLTEALLRDQSGTTRPDGYAGGGTGGRPSDVKLTAVEGIGVARARGTFTHDPLHEHVTSAIRDVLDAAAALQRAEHRLVAIRSLTEDAPDLSLACELCTEHGLGSPRLAEHYGTVGGRLSRSRNLCGQHHRYVDTHGHEPTPEQTRHHDETGTWRVRVAG